ncbi:DEAD-domain-containing protein [Piromyces finnis]|uniref:ATP-dependent RNA helicase n=1 Tax=Piromyces finnis TaxID=1754191 RepID=A0A1Y1UXC3_9FUNG|nr:DEAD-domain-containing protein [Piromyces finnis]|eukprot:ORX42875.1 DEAD-domain-containing protein [Piromyces finnis]
MESIANAGTWDSLNPKLMDDTLQALSLLGYTQMTPVQASTIPLFLNSKDVIVEAVTGSGKTLAFLIPIIEMIKKSEIKLSKKKIEAIIISPTRELAKQIYDVCTHLLEAMGCMDETTEKVEEIEGLELDDQNKINNKFVITTQLFIGGNSVQEDIQKFQKFGGNIIIGTPGRLEDLLKRHVIFNTNDLEVLILDEADRLLDMGFEKSLRNIFLNLPKQRRTGLFSATMSDALTDLIKAGLRNPVRIMVKVEDISTKDIQRTPQSLDICYLICKNNEKIAQFCHILKNEPDKKFIVYFATCSCVDYYFKALNSLPLFENYSLFSLHGKMDPKRRENVYKNFISAIGSSILLCTDVAARGLDIPDVDWVIQIDPPQDPKCFAHRCGRTARLGKKGKAVVFLTPKEDTYVDFLKIRKIPMKEIKKYEDEDFESTENEKTSIINSKLINEQLLDKNSKDRELYEKSVKAFVSWVRAYNEHQVSFIFRFKNVDIALVAEAYGLLRLPRMPELKNKKIEYKGLNIDVSI